MTDKRTKAQFRAMRERVGMTRETMAELIGVSVRSVRYWETIDSKRFPPQDAWDVLDDALEHQRAIITFTLNKVTEIIKEMGETPEAIRLPYWLSRKQYEEGSEDSKYGLNGDWHMANANAQTIAIILETQGIDVEWEDFNPANPANYEEADDEL